MKNQTIVLLLVLGSLCFGILIYASTRTDTLFLNQIITPLGGQFLFRFKDFLAGIPIPQWIIYSLPDALWMSALTLLIMMIWDFRLDRRSMPWLIIALVCGLLFEIGQGLHLVRGTFDIIDLLSIFIGASIPITFIFIKSHLWNLK